MSRPWLFRSHYYTILVSVWPRVCVAFTVCGYVQHSGVLGCHKYVIFSTPFHGRQPLLWAGNPLFSLIQKKQREGSLSSKGNSSLPVPILFWWSTLWTLFSAASISNILPTVGANPCHYFLWGFVGNIPLGWAMLWSRRAYVHYPCCSCACWRASEVNGWTCMRVGKICVVLSTDDVMLRLHEGSLLAGMLVTRSAACSRV